MSYNPWVPRCDCENCRRGRAAYSYTQQTIDQQQKYEFLRIVQLEIEKINNATGVKFTLLKDYPRINIQENTNQGDTDTMRGYEYVQPYNRYKANYTHLRAMLNEIWKRENTPGYLRFTIDIKFERDRDKIADYLMNMFTPNQLDNAHNDARANYKRGRPQGALNKDKIKSFSELDALLEDSGVDYSNGTTDGTQENKPTGEGMLDISQFVTHTFLKSKNYVNVAELRDILTNVENTLRNHHEQEIAKIKLQAPTILELKRGNLPEIKLGVQHRCFPTLLRMCAASLRSGHKLNAWVYGPAGTGKSTAAEKVAEALELEFYTLGKQSTEYGILGFINVSGYQTTEFRKAYENGGIFCGDEIDGWMPDALIALNMALANGHCAFPDRMVKRHPNFIFIACANTVGTGATMDYVGRMKQDAAFLDRFVSLYWPLDEGLEDSLVANKDWLKRVREVRNAVQRVGIKGHLITPRAAIFGESLLAAGLTMAETEASTLKKGLSDTQWEQVKPRGAY